VEKGIEQGRRPELVGGGLIRSLGGWAEVKKMLLARPWLEDRRRFDIPESLSCCLVDRFPDDVLSAHSNMYRNILADSVLSREERSTWQNMKGSNSWRNQWLRGRIAAKEAVRRSVQDEHDLALFPADIEIVPDRHGRPMACGMWTSQIASTPSVSIAHTGDVAVAVAGRLVHGGGVGIDIERIERVIPENVVQYAFCEQERILIPATPDGLRQEWILRFWCAKEAAGKIIGSGIIGQTGNIRIEERRIQSGKVTVSVAEKLARKFKDLKKKTIRVATFQSDGLVVGISC